MVIFGYFCTENCQFFMNFHDNSKNKNRKIDFSFDSRYCASSMNLGSKLRGWGVYITLVGTSPRALILLFVFKQLYLLNEQWNGVSSGIKYRVIAHLRLIDYEPDRQFCVYLNERINNLCTYRKLFSDSC